MHMASEVNQENLSRIKDNISTSYQYFKDNAKRFRGFRTFVFKESINDKQRTLLRKQGRPLIEFNILEAFISRLLGEFSKHEPSIDVSPSEGVPIPQPVIDTVENHFRHLLYEANKNSFAYETYKDLLSGGYSVAKVWTDYASPMSFNQEINLSRVFDPTLCGFDPMARASHKGDGNYCFELYPMTDKDFLREFPGQSLDGLKYSQNVEEFSWAYKDIKNNKLVLVGSYYEKKKKKATIVQLANGLVMTTKKYKEMQEMWEREQIIEQIPAIVGKPRTTTLETVCCYQLMQSKILKYYETDYAYLPLVFIDGNSIILSNGEVNSSYQMTRPYVYHAKGVQELKNYAGQCLANYLQTMVQHKFIIKKEAIVQQSDSLEALKNIQKANTLIVNAYSENNPDKPIPDPITPVVNVPAPPEVMGAFQITDPTTQAILGSFASNQGENKYISGKAVIESISVDNAAAEPYVVGYLAGLTQIANICVDLMPKYILGKRTIPVVPKNGKKDYQEVNTEGNPNLDYNERALKVNVEAGVNFQVQKNQAVEQVIALSQAMPSFAEFINSEEGMPILLKNLTIYGADSLEEMVQPWFQKRAQQQQQAMQMQEKAMQNDPRMIKAQADMQKNQMAAQKQQSDDRQQEFDNQLALADQIRKDKETDAKLIVAESTVSQDQIDSIIRMEEAHVSQENHALDAAAKIAEAQGREHDRALKTHDAILNTHKLHHEINKKEETQS